MGDMSKRAAVTDELWSEREERLLYEAIEGPEEDKCWEDIIEKVQREIPNFRYEPNDCMRYFKHYINPSWYSEEWPMEQGFFLCVLIKVHGHNWDKLADLLQEKNPLTLKNYYNSYMHKAMKHAGNGYIPWAILDKASNFFEWMQALDEVHERYFKVNSNEENKKAAELIKKVQLDPRRLKEYKERVLKRFREVQGEEKLPIGLVIDLGRVSIRGSDARMLVKAAPAICAELKDFVTITFTAPESEEELRKEKRSFQFPVYRSMLPVYVFKQPIPEPVMCPSVSNYPPQMMFSPQVQAGIVMPQPQERSYDHQRKNDNPESIPRKDIYK